ncbi:MAG TPA: sugar MFS transporter [Dongiaceae bacterium]|nr:sugar MFS transporter [Dongiaceae bacterium]
MGISSSSAQPPGAGSPPASGPTYRGPFAIMTVLFFMWGFMSVWNDILIPRFKEAFGLNYFQAMLVQLAFFGAYSMGGLIYFLASMVSGDPINRVGYKRGVVTGLLIAAAGSALLYPAAGMASYPFILSALFIIGLGLALLQIAANPYVTILGPERTASSRLNLSQAFNSFGTTIGPLIGGWLIFTVFIRPGAHGADSVKIPYLGFAAAYVLLAIFFTFAHVPAFTNPHSIPRGFGALKHPHTVLGMIAIFMYVGGEISTGSILVNFLGSERLGRIPKEIASGYLAFYWGGLMIGRFMGAFALSDLRRPLKHALVVAVPVAAFLAILALPALGRGLHLGWERAELLCSLSNALRYGLFLAVLLGAFFLGESSPHRMLALFSGVILALLLTGIVSAGETAKWAILGVGLFCSVMWSNIFSLAIEGLGPLKSQASSLLVVAILGGAILPPTQGRVADLWGVQVSFVVPMLAFTYIAFYGLYGYRAGRKPSNG